MSQVPDLGPDFRVLKRVPYTSQFASLEGWQWLVSDDRVHDMEYILALVDFETTGLDKHKDEVIEMGLVLVGINEGETPVLLGVGDWLNQPEKPITEEITKITGITADLVAGKSLDIKAIKEVMAYADGIAAHNADFDRAFYDRYLETAFLPWFCTSKGGDIDWKELGQNSSGLENLLVAHGYFYDAHRAVIDCIATVQLLQERPDALAMMFERGTKSSYRIKAIGSPFSVKDQLKEAGYRWDADAKQWWILVTGAEKVEPQLALLESLYFGGRNYATVTEISPIDKYRSSK